MGIDILQLGKVVQSSAEGAEPRPGWNLFSALNAIMRDLSLLAIHTDYLEQDRLAVYIVTAQALAIRLNFSEHRA